jgi:hypothetical protein
VGDVEVVGIEVVGDASGLPGDPAYDLHIIVIFIRARDVESGVRCKVPLVAGKWEFDYLLLISYGDREAGEARAEAEQGDPEGAVGSASGKAGTT